MTDDATAPAPWWPRSGPRRSRAPAAAWTRRRSTGCARQVAELRELGHSVVLVSSGAIAAGWFAMGGGPRPTDPATLQAVSAVGQSKLMRVYDEAFAGAGAGRGPGPARPARLHPSSAVPPCPPDAVRGCSSWAWSRW